MDNIPSIKVPTNLDYMSPREAWNACIEAHKPLIDWSLFWDDGRSIVFVKIKEDDVEVVKEKHWPPMETNPSSTEHLL